MPGAIPGAEDVVIGRHTQPLLSRAHMPVGGRWEVRQGINSGCRSS